MRRLSVCLLLVTCWTSFAWPDPSLVPPVAAGILRQPYLRHGIAGGQTPLERFHQSLNVAQIAYTVYSVATCGGIHCIAQELGLEVLARIIRGPAERIMRGQADQPGVPLLNYQIAVDPLARLVLFSYYLNDAQKLAERSGTPMQLTAEMEESLFQTLKESSRLIAGLTYGVLSPFLRDRLMAEAVEAYIDAMLDSEQDPNLHILEDMFHVGMAAPRLDRLSSEQREEMLHMKEVFLLIARDPKWLELIAAKRESLEKGRGLQARGVRGPRTAGFVNDWTLKGASFVQYYLFYLHSLPTSVRRISLAVPLVGVGAEKVERFCNNRVRYHNQHVSWWHKLADSIDDFFVQFHGRFRDDFERRFPDAAPPSCRSTLMERSL